MAARGKGDVDQQKQNNNFWHNSGIHIAIHCKLLPYMDTNIVTNLWHTHCNSLYAAAIDIAMHYMRHGLI
jgi:hypothetical protein